MILAIKVCVGLEMASQGNVENKVKTHKCLDFQMKMRQNII
jgi:hypothetical protein